MRCAKIVLPLLFGGSLLFQGCGGSSSSGNTAGNTGGDITKEPYYKYQWYIESANSVLQNAGFAIDPQADVNGAEALSITKGAGVVVAVIDEGADISHEDLQPNIIDTYNAENDSQKGVNPHKPGGAHGTTVSGFIAAPANGLGIVGMAPEAKLIIIRGIESEVGVIRAFEYARTHGARVINCSWGSRHVTDALATEIKAVHDAGITIVFAAGNNGGSLDVPGVDDEAELPWVIGVGASGENNDVTSYSDYGSNIDLIAPGGDAIESSGVLGLDDMGDAGNRYMQRGLVNRNYAFFEGTSFSAPITSGTIALMYAVNPSLTPDQIRNILISTATKVGNENASYNSNGFDERRAYGKLNAYEAVRAAAGL